MAKLARIRGFIATHCLGVDLSYLAKGPGDRARKFCGATATKSVSFQAAGVGSGPQACGETELGISNISSW